MASFVLFFFIEMKEKEVESLKNARSKEKMEAELRAELLKYFTAQATEYASYQVTIRSFSPESWPLTPLLTRTTLLAHVGRYSTDHSPANNCHAQIDPHARVGEPKKGPHTRVGFDHSGSRNGL